MTVAKRFGENLRHCRRRAGLSQEALARRAKVHRTTIGLLERGERIPRIDTALKLAAAMECEIADLAAGVEWVPAETEGGQYYVWQRSDAGS